jgi:hypothetical protein
MKTIDIEEMRGKLLTLDQARERLEATEHLAQYTFDTTGGNDVKFNFHPKWNVGLKEQADLFVTEGTISIDGFERRLTKEAALKAASEIGLPSAYVLKTPPKMIEEQLNYWFANGCGTDKGKELKMLASDAAGLAFTRATVNPYSNLELIDNAVAAITEKYGTDDILVDYKFHHDLNSTNMRLIVPSHVRHIGSARAAKSQDDPWSVGLELRNSIIGAESLEIRGYLFAWWCTNGATSTFASSGKYRRRPTADPSEAYDWARTVVDEVLGGLEHELDAVESLTQIPLEGELNETLHGIFESYNVPTRSRELVMANLVESDDLTAYGLMNAITGAANNDELSPSAIAQLLTAGGNVAHHMSDRCTNCHGTGHVGHNHD